MRPPAVRDSRGRRNLCIQSRLDEAFGLIVRYAPPQPGVRRMTGHGLIADDASLQLAPRRLSVARGRA